MSVFVLVLAAAGPASAEILVQSRIRIASDGHPNYRYTFGNGTAVDHQGNQYVVGVQTAMNGDFPSTNAVVWRLNADGTDAGAWVFGGTRDDEAKAVAVDDAGFVYITGTTTSPDFATANAAFPSAGGAADGFVVKLEWGRGAVFATYLGGALDDAGHGITVNADGTVVTVVGQTKSPAFPTTADALQPSISGSSDAFVTRLNGDGSLLYSTYFGGPGDDAAHGVALRGHCADVAGETAGGVLNMSGYGGGARDAFMLELCPPFAAWVDARYFGGSGRDVAYGIDIGKLNAVSPVWFLAGSTDSVDLPRAISFGGSSRHQEALGGGTDAFLAGLAPNWGIVYSTYLGGADDDVARAVRYDGGVSVAGQGGRGFPELRPLGVDGGTILGDAFVARFTPDRPNDRYTGLALYFSTLFGSARGDSAMGLAHGTSWAWLHTGGFMNAAVDFDNTSMTANVLVLSGRGEQGAPRTRFAGDWTTASSAAYSGGTAAVSAQPGARAEHDFTGTAFAWIGTRSPASGVALVSVDGGPAEPVDLWEFSGSTRMNRPVFQVTGLPNAPHRVSIEVTGAANRNSSTGGASVVVDAFEATDLPSAPARPTAAWKRVEENDPRFSFSGTWHTQPSGRHSGGSARLSMEAGDRVTFSGRGRGVRWIGLMDPWSGLADAGTTSTGVATVDAYAPAEYNGLALRTIEFPETRDFTFVLEVRGDRHPASAGAWVWLDAVEILTEDGAPSPTSTPTPTPTPTPTASPTPTPTPTGTPAFTRIEQTEISTTGWHDHVHPIHSGGSAVTAMDAGQSVRLTFTGTGVRWIGLKDPWCGIAGVSLDGASVAEIDTYSATEQAQTVLYAISGLAAGPHTLDIVVRGTRNGASGNNSIWVDAFDVESGGAATPTPGPTPTPTPTGPPPSTTRVEDGSIATSDSWRTHTHPVHSGGSAKISTDPGTSVEYTFTGTGIRWIGLKDPWSGIARVEIDGMAVADVDTYSAIEQARATLYEKTDLAAGTHRITIVIRPERNPASGNHAIWLDAFDVIGGP